MPRVTLKSHQKKITESPGAAPNRTPRFLRFFFTSESTYVALECPARERKTQAAAPALHLKSRLGSRLRSAAAMPEINLGHEEWAKRV